MWFERSRGYKEIGEIHGNKYQEDIEFVPRHSSLTFLSRPDRGNRHKCHRADKDPVYQSTHHAKEPKA